MKIYAVRDRLIDYFMQPFAAPGDKEVMASLARTINTGEATSDISQAPHQFELWKLAEVTEDGHIVPNRELVCDCASLVRRDIRRGDHAGATPPRQPHGGGDSTTGGTGNHARAAHSPLQGTTPPEDRAGAEIAQRPPGSHYPRINDGE